MWNASEISFSGGKSKEEAVKLCLSKIFYGRLKTNNIQSHRVRKPKSSHACNQLLNMAVTEIYQQNYRKNSSSVNKNLNFLRRFENWKKYLQEQRSCILYFENNLQCTIFTLLPNNRSFFASWPTYIVADRIKVFALNKSFSFVKLIAGM